jgi:hypothetical protein
MARTPRVTLQINVAPLDLPHAVHILPHQLRQWAGQTQEVLFTLDLQGPRRGRLREAWDAQARPMETLLEELCLMHPGARACTVDYAAETNRQVAEDLLDISFLPAKDTKGGSFYPYFYGLHRAQNDLVLHLDSDVMFGGGSQTWIAEACRLLEEHPIALACSPLPGPPMAAPTLRTQAARRFQHDSLAFCFSSLSTRLFVIDRRDLRERLRPLELPPPIRAASRLAAMVRGNPPYGAAELMLSKAMQRAGLLRVDFLGSPPGMWSLHPPFRSPDFYRALPRLIESIEAGDVPEAQRGDYDLNDSMFDWSHARRRARFRRLWG